MVYYSMSIPRFVDDVGGILTQMEDSFLKLAECQHMLETQGKSDELLGLYAF